MPVCKRLGGLGALIAGVATCASAQLFLPKTLPDATQGKYYWEQISPGRGYPSYHSLLAAGSTLPDGLQMSDTAYGPRISGTPTVFGQFSFAIQVTDSSTPALTETRQYSLTIHEGGSHPFVFTSNTLPDAISGGSYGPQILVTGGTYPYSGTITGYTGFFLDMNGSLWCNPVYALPGVYTMTISMMDSSFPNQSISQTFTITVKPGLQLNQTLMTGTALQAYSDRIQVIAGGTPPYAFTVTNGQLPPGLQLDAGTGTISGTAAAPGTFFLTVGVSDANGLTGAAQFYIEVYGATLTVSPSGMRLPTGTVGVPYPPITYAVTGGVPPYTINAATGLPPGLTLDSQGVLSGTPTAGGTYNVGFSIQDHIGDIVGVAQLIDIRGLYPDQLMDGRIGQSYLEQFFGQGLTNAWQLSIISGSLPPGITLLSFGGAPAEANRYYLSGTPTQRGTYTFTVQAGDPGDVQVVRTYTLRVSPAILTITKSHSGNFRQGQPGAVFLLTVGNKGAGPTTDPVTVFEDLPPEVTLGSMSGEGWSCSGPSCTRSDALNTGVTYPPITVSVNVAPNAPTQVTNRVAVSGGGSLPEAATDTVTVLPVVVTADSVSPGGGTGTAQTFTLQYSDTGGGGDLSTAWVWVNSSFSSSAANSCMLHYSKPSNGFFLLTDGGAAWIGPATVGSPGILGNNQCIVDMGSSSVTVSGDQLVLNIALKFTPAFQGVKNVYLYASNGGVSSGWQTLGTWTIPAGATTLSADSVLPSSGSGMRQVFAAQYSDIAGGADLSQAAVWITGTGESSLVQTCMVSYSRSTNSLQLLMDAGTSWSTPGPLGTAGNISNSQCSIDLGNSSAAVSGTLLTLSVDVTFAPVYSGTKSIWTYATNGSVNTAWRPLGTWMVASTTVTVAPISATPSNGTGMSQVFAFQYADTNGGTDLNLVYGWIKSGAVLSDAQNGCQFYYANVSNNLYLASDDGTAWQRGSTVGLPGTLSNHQCSIDLGASSAAITGTRLTLNVAITFSNTYAGAKNVYAAATNTNDLGPWQLLGTWTVPGTVVTLTADSSTPSTGAGLTQNFSFQLSDSNGGTDLLEADVWFNSGGPFQPPVNSCQLLYVKGQGLYLLSDFQGSYLPSKALGSAGTLANSQCSVNVAASSVMISGSHMILNLSMNFTTAFLGLKNISLRASNGIITSGWQTVGTWTVTSSVVTADSAAPNSGMGMSQSFSLQYSDSTGGSDLTEAWVWVNGVFAQNAANTCMLYYSKASNGVLLLKDDGITWSAPRAIGVAGTLSNGQCSVDLGSSSLAVSGTHLTLNLAITFSGGFLGAKNLYTYATNGTINSGWQTVGSWTVAAPAAITADSVTPGTGSGLAQTFALQYSDSMGGSDVTQAWVWVSASFGSSAANSCMFYYSKASNGVVLLNDAGTGWGAPGTIASAGTLSNGQCSINLGNSSVTISGTNLMLNLAMTFTNRYAGAKNIYAYATNGSANSGWRALGTWTPATPATITADSVTPASGSGATQTFAAQYSDSSGGSDLTQAWVWFHASFGSSAANSCMMYYSKASNGVSLLNDAGSGWTSSMPLGSAGTLVNSQCSLDLANSSLVISGTPLALNLAVTFTSGYAGTKHIYAYATNDAANSGWQTLGTWAVPTAVVTVTADSITPGSGTGAVQSFALQFSDSSGGTDISQAWVWINSSYGSSAANSCMLFYSKPSNGLLLLSDAGNTWSSPMAIGAAGTLSNGQCSVNLGSSSLVVSGTHLMMNLALTFTGAYAGAKNVYGYATNGGANSGWQTLGTWTVPSSAVTVSADSVTPGSGSGSGATFAFKYSDSNGGSDVSQGWVWINSSYGSSAANSCMMFYSKASNALLLLNDAGNTWSSPVAIGTTGMLSNGQCSVNLGSSSLVVSGTHLTMNLALTFTGAYAGAKNVYGYATNGGANSGWQTLGTWTVPSSAVTVTADSVTPGSGNGSGATFAFQYSDSNGGNDLSQAWVWITAGFGPNAANSCMMFYSKASNGLLLLNDVGSAWSAPAPIGTAGTLSNSQCSVNLGSSSLVASGTHLTLNLAITFPPAYNGAKSVFLYGTNGTVNSGWQARGTWTVP